VTAGAIAAPEEQPRLSRGEARRVVWGLAAPTLVEMLLVSLTGMADMMQCGRLGPAAITGIGLTNQPMFLLQAVFLAVNVGTTAVVARFTGMRRADRASEALRQTLAVTLPLGVLTSVVAGAFASKFLVFMGADAEVVRVGTPYFQAVGYGFVFNAIAMATAAALRGAGDTRSPMTVNLVANLVNIIGNAILIWGLFGFPRWGVFGAGVATGFSRLVAAVWFAALVLKGRHRLRLALRQRYRPDREILRSIYRIGLPAAGEQLVMRSGQVLFAKIVASLGTVTFAAHQVTMNILSLSFQPGQAFATAAAALVGQYLGARRPDDAERCANTSRDMGLVIGLAMGLLFVLAGKYIALLYTDDPAVILASALILRIYAVAQPFQSTQFILAGGLRGAGDTTYPLYSTAIGIWAGRVVVGYVFVNFFHWGLVGAWVAIGVDQVARAVLIWVRFRSGKWKHAPAWGR